MFGILRTVAIAFVSWYWKRWRRKRGFLRALYDEKATPANRIDKNLYVYDTQIVY